MLLKHDEQFEHQCLPHAIFILVIKALISNKIFSHRINIRIKHNQSNSYAWVIKSIINGQHMRLRQIVHQAIWKIKSTAFLPFSFFICIFLKQKKCLNAFLMLRETWLLEQFILRVFRVCFVWLVIDSTYYCNIHLFADSSKAEWDKRKTFGFRGIFGGWLYLYWVTYVEIDYPSLRAQGLCAVSAGLLLIDRTP